MARRRAASRTDWRTEKQVEHAGDELMASVFGDDRDFKIVRLSQSRATMQTPGIPDRRYYMPKRRMAVWWEAKTAIGRQSPFQAAFQVTCEACGEEYVVGTDEVLVDWLVAKGFAERLPNGLRVLRKL
ncbi:MAG TPA: hypothetical protein VKD00_06915 [Methyloceanibacter sp.]|nr:hypothetical protein [Methyloceanibacter sp.]